MKKSLGDLMIKRYENGRDFENSQKLSEVINKPFFEKWIEENKPYTLIIEGIYYILAFRKNKPQTYRELKNDKDISTEVNSIVEELEYITRKSDTLKESVLDHFILSPRDFVKLTYHLISNFPDYVKEMYFNVTKEELFLSPPLDHLSPFKEVYRNYAKRELWTLKEACCLVSHIDPDIDI